MPMGSLRRLADDRVREVAAWMMRLIRGTCSLTALVGGAGMGTAGWMQPPVYRTSAVCPLMSPPLPAMSVPVRGNGLKAGLPSATGHGRER